jgi:hypothetical protein
MFSEDFNRAGANITVTPSSGTAIAAANYVTNLGGKGWLGTTVGSTCTVTSTSATDNFAGRDHVVVAGWFTDGAQQVILDTYV